MEIGEDRSKLVTGAEDFINREGNNQTAGFLRVTKSAKKPGVLCPDCHYIPQGIEVGRMLNWALCKECHSKINGLDASDRRGPLVTFKLANYNNITFKERKILEDILEYLGWLAKAETWSRDHKSGIR